MSNAVTVMKRPVTLLEPGLEDSTEATTRPKFLARLNFVYVFFALAIALVLLMALSVAWAG